VLKAIFNRRMRDKQLERIVPMARSAPPTHVGCARSESD